MKIDLGVISPVRTCGVLLARLQIRTHFRQPPDDVEELTNQLAFCRFRVKHHNSPFYRCPANIAIIL